MAGQTPAKTYGYDPQNNDTDAVRLLIGDTTPATMYLFDSEVRYYLAESGSVKCAAADAALGIAAKVAREVDCATGSARRSASQRHQHYLDLAKRLRAEADGLASMWAGGQSRDEKVEDRESDDLIQPSFTVGMHDLESADDTIDDELVAP